MEPLQHDKVILVTGGASGIVRGVIARHARLDGALNNAGILEAALVGLAGQVAR